MPKESVTQAVFNYLQPSVSQIPNLGVVYTALPKVGDESDLFTNTYPGLGLGCAIYMFITQQLERRIALGGPHNGRKWRHYDMGMLIVFKSDLSQTEAGQTAFDQFIDNLTAYIEADRNADDPSVVFQWGEGDELGGPDIHIDYTIPRTIDGGVTIYQGVAHVTVAEVLQT